MKKSALVSVYDKSGIISLCRELIKNDFDIFSTSGTARLLRENGIQIMTIEELTKYPEILGGRVKTLHPLVFSGLLADRSNPEHIRQAEEVKARLFDLLVVNLYPFAETVSRERCSLEEAIEQIDIGGVSLIRAAAKNFKHVSVLVSPSQYTRYLGSLEKKEDINLKLASDAFSYISGYDREIAGYFSGLEGNAEEGPLNISFTGSTALRYGENPHQKAGIFYNETDNFFGIFELLHGKEISYNNVLDIDASYGLISEFQDTTCAIVKHTNPCGVASRPSLHEAYSRALATDNVSAYGGIVVCNARMDMQTAAGLDRIFTEVVMAPDYDGDALEFLKKKKNRRLIRFRAGTPQTGSQLRSVTGGLLVQEHDMQLLREDEIKYVTARKPTADELKDLIFAMKVAKHTKSNAVVYAKGSATCGIGGGQPSRVDSSMLAVDKAVRFGLDLKGSAVASDAFFPFPDGVIEAAKAGAGSVIQPGGSVRDQDVIKAADDFGLAMVFTGMRHFKH